MTLLHDMKHDKSCDLCLGWEDGQRQDVPGELAGGAARLEPHHGRESRGAGHPGKQIFFGDMYKIFSRSDLLAVSADGARPGRGAAAGHVQAAAVGRGGRRREEVRARVPRVQGEQRRRHTHLQVAS